jgi:hypothetical protein
MAVLIVLLLAVSLLAGCDPTHLPGPKVYLDFGEAFNLKPLAVGTQWVAADLDWIYKGALVWRRLGFDVRPLGEPIDGSLDPAQVVVIQIYRDEGLRQENKFGGLSDRITVSTFLNAGLQDFRLMSTAAHEIGHQLLESSEHLTQAQNGLMSPFSTGFDITDADAELACRVAARCKRY